MAKNFPFRVWQRDYILTFKAGFFLFCLFFIVLFHSLGVWQWHRFHHKKDLLMHYQTRISAPPILLSNLGNNFATMQFQAITAKGHYLNDQTLLIQNRFYRDQLGYEVITPLQIAGEKKLLLIDRGWIKKPNQTMLPTIQLAVGEQSIIGYIKLLNEYQFILGPNVLTPDQKPLLLQRLDIQELEQQTHRAYFPFLVRLNAALPNGYIRDWTITSVMPERHLGYAIQWFVMAWVLVIAYFCFSCRRVNT